jgi:hypothetical protein
MDTYRVFQLYGITPGMSALGKARKGFEKEDIYEDSWKR